MILPYTEFKFGKILLYDVPTQNVELPIGATCLHLEPTTNGIYLHFSYNRLNKTNGVIYINTLGDSMRLKGNPYHMGSVSINSQIKHVLWRQLDEKEETV